MHDGDDVEKSRKVLIDDREGEGHGMKTGHSSHYSINMHAYTKCNGRLAPPDLLTNDSVLIGSYPKRAGPNTPCYCKMALCTPLLVRLNKSGLYNSLLRQITLLCIVILLQ